MMLPPPLLDRRGETARLWRRFSARGAPTLAVVALVGLLVIAALAPLLCQDRPLRIETVRGTEWPLLRSASALDVVWAGGFIAVLAAGLAWRLLAPRTAARPVALACLATGLVSTLIVATGHDPVNETRRYLGEERARRALSTLDRRLADSDSNPVKAPELDTFAALAVLTDVTTVAAIRENVTVTDEAATRLDVLRDVRDDGERRRRLGELAADNERELVRLESAVHPPVRFSPETPGPDILVAPGTRGHVLGTDGQGRDVLARVIWGTRTALTAAFGTTAVIAVIGLVLGILGGWMGRMTDSLTTRLGEAILCLPALVVMVAMPAWMPREWRRNPLTMIVFLGLLLWPTAARLVRAEVVKLRAGDHVRSAIALGLTPARVIARHVLPGAIPPLLVSLGLTAGHVILIESSLAFLGLGVEETPSWGRILAEARAAALRGDAWHMALFPGVAVVGSMLIFNLISDGLDRALDPREEISRSSAGQTP